MPTWEDVRRLALSLPETTEKAGATLQWRVKKPLFVWERPLRHKDLADLGWDEQPGPVLGLRVEDEGAKHALIADDPEVFFTTPHFDGYPAVLARLDLISPEVLAEVVESAWLCRAPVRARRAYLDEHA